MMNNDVVHTAMVFRSDSTIDLSKLPKEVDTARVLLAGENTPLLIASTETVIIEFFDSADKMKLDDMLVSLVENAKKTGRKVFPTMVESNIGKLQLMFRIDINNLNTVIQDTSSKFIN